MYMVFASRVIGARKYCSQPHFPSLTSECVCYIFTKGLLTGNCTTITTALHGLFGCAMLRIAQTAITGCRNWFNHGGHAFVV